ncbi:MAG: LPS export ABC transporter periplasmic protein LptC [Lamprobacter sp.]|uniref:LPS export ABC transporter periplasmic protein LptC n=1 Tax=Lamprobacter sp. TaxID=3100796 RepID=UPI002B263A52|nr:LPS export ABC transporter periplasmic protein LptC [Lamprobacter sp.]MEA3638796.1 LPS export ABC transporter periplasmic protein LptC [Lamprobacter sp.]
MVMRAADGPVALGAGRERWLAVLLVVTGLLSWWLLPARDPGQGPRAGGDRRPDYVVEGLRALSLDNKGMPYRRLDARRLRHYADDGSSELDDPVLLVHDDDGPDLRARSVLAWINASGDEILLEQDVRLQRAATADSAPIELRTSELLFLPQFDYAETSHFVEIEREQDWISATDGLRAWLGSATRIQLFGRARAALAGDDDAAQRR